MKRLALFALLVLTACLPVSAATPTSSVVPIPISMRLPGGWVFPIGKNDWDPNAGAEVLTLQPEPGPEVCRAVILSWTIQMQALLRNLKGNDEIKITMSNYDTLTYKFQSIEQVPSSELAKLASNAPCLLVILPKKDTDTRLVVTAKP